MRARAEHARHASRRPPAISMRAMPCYRRRQERWGYLKRLIDILRGDLPTLGARFDDGRYNDTVALMPVPPRLMFIIHSSRKMAVSFDDYARRR